MLVAVDRGFDPKGEGHIYSFDRETGKVQWKRLAAPGVSCDLLHQGPQVIAYSQSGDLLSLDLHTGEVGWKRPLTRPSSVYLPSPVFIDQVIVAATPDGKISAVNTPNGALLWTQEVAKNAYLQPLALQNALYVLSSKGSLYRLDVTSGRVLEQLRLGAAFSFYPAVTEDSIVVEFQDHTLKRIKPSTGVVWSQKAGSGLTTHKPLLLRDDVIVAEETGTLAAYHLRDGSLDWSTRFLSLKAPITALGTDGENLFVGTQGGTLFSVPLRSLENYGR